MNWYDNEAAFLSVYTAAKLEKGGDPFVTTKELQKVVEAYANSRYYKDVYEKKIKTFNFEDLEGMAQRFQKVASINRPWLGPCFEYKDGKLYPTYEFFNIDKNNFGSLTNFLVDYKFTKTPLGKNMEEAGDQAKKLAKLAATYITKFFAQSYIDREVERGRWPNHMRDVSSIFSKDLGRVLELEGTREYFTKFFGRTYEALAEMIEQHHGKLLLQSTCAKNLRFNNFARATGGEHLGTVWPHTSKYGDKSYRMEIQNGQVVVNETKLEFSDPYGEWSDVYSHTTTTLDEKNTNLNQGKEG